MLPTSSSTDLVGRNARSATVRIKGLRPPREVWRLPNVSGWHKPTHKAGGSQQTTEGRCIDPHPPAPDRPDLGLQPGLGRPAWWYVPPALSAPSMRICGMAAGIGMALAISACGGGQNQ